MWEFGGREARGPGCMAGAARLAALGVLGPVAAVRRWWRARRRGNRAGVSVRERDVDGRPGFTRLDLELDLPPGREPTVRRELTELVVRVAESLGRGDEVYHLIYRSPWEFETELKGVGPRLQDLGERFHQHLGRNELERTTSVWVALPRGRYLGTLLDPATYDPGGEGEPDGLFRELPCRWGFAAAWARGEASVLFRLALYVPDGGIAAARKLLGVCRDRLGGWD